jgi:hypothetical protein
MTKLRKKMNKGNNSERYIKIAKVNSHLAIFIFKLSGNIIKSKSIECIN